jgi:ABC-type nickel/cobalt efflux system permease component RcnA
VQRFNVKIHTTINKIMKYEAIKELLERYWDGDTTLEEERQIKAYFAGTSIDTRLQSVAPMFGAIQAEQAVRTSGKALQLGAAPTMQVSYKKWWLAAASVALMISGSIWWYSQTVNETQMAVAPISIEPEISVSTPKTAETAIVNNTVTPVKPTITNRKRIVKPQLVAQQAPAIIVNAAPEAEDTYKTPEEALEEVRAALALVSKKMKKGQEEAFKYLEEVKHAEL